MIRLHNDGTEFRYDTAGEVDVLASIDAIYASMGVVRPPLPPAHYGSCVAPGCINNVDAECAVCDEHETHTYDCACGCDGFGVGPAEVRS